MCGLAGFAGGVAPTPEDRLDLERMIATLHHRGPDARGVHLSPGDASLLFRWATPELPEGWHSVRRWDEGAAETAPKTLVHVRK